MIFIHDIAWNRSFFEIGYTVDEGENGQLYLYKLEENVFIPFETEQNEAAWKARVNIVTACKREVLSVGQWMICKKIDQELLDDFDKLLEVKPYLRTRIDNKKSEDYISNNAHRDLAEKDVEDQRLYHIIKHPYDTHGILYDDSILNNLIEYSVVYRYAGKKYAYAISLVAGDDYEGNVYLALEPEFFKRNLNPQSNRKGKASFVRRVMQGFDWVIKKTVQPFRNGKRILFLKQNGDRPTENMVALQQRMRERGINRKFSISCRYHNVFSGRQRPVAWFRDMVLIARSDYIFLDDYTPIFNFIDPIEGTTLIQLWHAGVGFKSVGYARFGLNASPDPYASGHRKYTYALVGNAGLRDIYSEVFGIEKSALLATGMPRLDHFLNNDVISSAQAKLYKQYPRLHAGRVILFAPTFRGAGQRDAYYPYQVINMEALYEMCIRTNSYFIFEMHHFIQNRPCINQRFADRILDLSDENLDQLFYVSDVLVTDYSSCFYDYLLLEKPIVFFTPDRQVYSATRGVQRPIKEAAPGVVCDTFEDFLDVLENERYESVTINRSVIDRAHENGALASDRVIDTILFNKDVPGVKLDNETA